MIFDQVDCQRLPRRTSPRRCAPGRYMKFPFIKSLGPEHGWYRVGPLARVNTCDFIDTPDGRGGAQGVHGADRRQAEQRHAWPTTGRGMIELLHSVEKIQRAAARPGPAGHGPGRQGRAPRGGRRHRRGPARHAVPPLPGRRARPGQRWPT
ncbi:MAG: hypothetical protein MZU79_02310 [Anaerotruncus sp.]|nr:hypothetical protein [Anaerotruncus sp.]